MYNKLKYIKMKKVFILIILLSLISLRLSARFPEPGEYKQNPEIGKYVGTWEWANGTDTIRIIIKKMKLQTDIPNRDGQRIIYYRDFAVGWHIYIKNGVVVESIMDKANMQFATSDEARQNSSFVTTNAYKTKISGTFIDLSKDRKREMLVLKFVPGTSNQLTWQLFSWWDFFIEGVTPYQGPPGFTLPTKDIVLTKKLSILTAEVFL
jgi:hypothetical protein